MAAAVDRRNPDPAGGGFSLTVERESQVSGSGDGKGGWITFPFIAGALAGLTLAATGWGANLIVYLIEEFNVKRIDAAQISNVVTGSTALFPIIGAIAADGFFGSFSVIALSSCVSLLGLVLLALTTLDILRPEDCGAGSRQICRGPSKMELAVLYTGITLAVIGQAGTRFTLATMGANQFHNPKHQHVFFNWYFFCHYVSTILGSTVLVYVEDNVSWTWGFAISVLVNILALFVFLLGSRFYCHVRRLQGSPFLDLARVLVAAVRKRKVFISLTTSDDGYYHCDPSSFHHHDHGPPKTVTSPTTKLTKDLRFLNRAALKTEGDTGADGSIAKPWRLCTVQQVEDLKTLIRIFPLWSSGLFLATPIGMQASLTVLQALIMDRHLGPHFRIPAGSFLVVSFIGSALLIPLVDRLLSPLWAKLARRPPTPLQRVGVGHVLNALSMAASAVVESRRLRVVHSHRLSSGAVTPMLGVWLFPQLILVGAGEAFHFPGQVSLYYQEFPESLRSTATAMISLVIGISFYLGTAVIDLIRRTTTWLPDDLNKGRLDNVYWLLTGIGLVNFSGFLVCAKRYKYKNSDDDDDDHHASHGTQNDLDD